MLVSETSEHHVLMHMVFQGRAQKIAVLLCIVLFRLSWCSWLLSWLVSSCLCIQV